MIVYGLDYLRGLAAFFIAVYHLLKWNGISLSNNGVFSKLGVYGVSVFFILSGYAMHFVYKNMELDYKTIIVFKKKKNNKDFSFILVCYNSYFNSKLCDMFFN